MALPTVRFNRGKIADLLPALTETVEGIRSDIIGLAAPKRRGGPGRLSQNRMLTLLTWV